MSNAVFARGTLLKIDDGAGNYTTIPECMNIKGPALVLDTVDVTNHDSPSGAKEFIGGLLDGGTVTADINFQPSNAVHKQLYGDMFNRVKRNFKLVYPDTSTDTFVALVTKFDPSASEKDRLLTALELRITGWPTLP